MSDYGCCTMSLCIHEDDYESCDDCPFYDKNFFKEKKQQIEEIDINEMLKFGVPYNKALECGKATSEVLHIKADRINLAFECTFCPFSEPIKTR